MTLTSGRRSASARTLLCIGCRVHRMASERKRRKLSGGGADLLSQLLHVGGARGLAKLLEKLRGVDVSELAATDWQLRETNLRCYRRLQHTEAMPLTSGGSFDWELLHPNLLLVEMVERSAAFRSRVIAAFRRCPPTTTRPWNLVVGFDECSPGVRGWAWGRLGVAARSLCVSGTAAGTRVSS